MILIIYTIYIYIGLTPFHSDRLLMSGAGVAGILTVLHACLDLKATILDKYHYLLYFLVPAMNPRYVYVYIYYYICCMLYVYIMCNLYIVYLYCMLYISM